MIKSLIGKSARDLVCSVSDMLQDYYGLDIWGQALYEDIFAYVTKHVKPEESYNIVIDDWRRPLESEYLINKNTFNVIKVYLDKEGKKSKASKGSSHYEGQIKPEDCDIVFTYTKNYSNFDELIGLIQNAIK